MYFNMGFIKYIDGPGWNHFCCSCFVEIPLWTVCFMDLSYLVEEQLRNNTEQQQMVH